MWSRFTAMGRKLLHIRKSPSRVADESMFRNNSNNNVNEAAEVPIFGGEMGQRDVGGIGFSMIHSVFRAPLWLLSCLSQPHVHGSEGIVWMSGEFSQSSSEMNHLMVNDSMRYAILM